MQVVTTQGPDQAPEALFKDLQDFDTVLVCGGDGTVNQVVQSLMVDDRPVALAVIPFGSANFLAKELGMCGKLDRLVNALLESIPRPYPLACVEQIETGKCRYWAAAAGVGTDASVICSLSPSAKSRFGIAAYYTECARRIVFSAPRFPRFAVEFEDASTGLLRKEIVVQVVAERIGFFGAFLEMPGTAPLPPGQFRVVLLKNAHRSTFLRYGLCVVGGQALRGRHGVSLDDVEVVRTRELRCFSMKALGSETQHAAGSAKVLAEVDGEFFGELPVRLFQTQRQLQILRPLDDVRS